MAFFLVTGGCGFIGSHLVDALVTQGHRVRILDNLTTGREENAPTAAELVVADVTDSEAVKHCITGADGIFHLAAIASVEQSRRDWAGCHAVNLGGCIKVLDAARRQANAPRVVYASSAAVYGDNAAVPLTEADTPSPINAYGADKYGCELHGRIARLLYGIPTVGLRFFNVYGPRQDPRSPYSGVISIFCERLRRGAPLEIFGDGTQTRDFIAVADVVAALRAAQPVAQAAARGPVPRQDSSDAPVFNVCTGIATSIIELAHTIAALAGVPTDIRHAPPRAGEIRHSVGAPNLSQRALGLAPPVALRDGLRRVLDWLGTPG